MAKYKTEHDCDFQHQIHIQNSIPTFYLLVIHLGHSLYSNNTLQHTNILVGFFKFRFKSVISC